MAAYLFKTEPSAYSWADLVREGRTTWDGVKNAVALKHLRAVAPGDTIAIYHTGDEKAVVGLATAASAGRPDPRDPKLVVVDLTPLRPLAAPVPLAAFRGDPALATTAVVRVPRLSVVPLTAAQLARIEALGR
jgi:predicted RNA-binding protein with PUA-like domain